MRKTATKRLANGEKKVTKIKVNKVKSLLYSRKYNNYLTYVFSFNPLDSPMRLVLSFFLF